MQRFFLDPSLLEKDEIQITDTVIVHQAFKVLRMKPLDKFIALDSQGNMVTYEITLIDKRSLSARLVERAECKDFKMQLNLYIGMPNRQSKFEEILKMCTETGVSTFYPVVCERSQLSKLQKEERLDHILREASEQSERCIIPSVKNIQKFEDLDVPEGVNIACVERGDHYDLIDLLDLMRNKEKINVFVGPEGGYTEEEVNWFKEKGFNLASLGPNILKTETAAVVACGIVRQKNQ